MRIRDLGRILAERTVFSKRTSRFMVAVVAWPIMLLLFASMLCDSPPPPERH